MLVVGLYIDFGLKIDLKIGLKIDLVWQPCLLLCVGGYCCAWAVMRGRLCAMLAICVKMSFDFALAWRACQGLLACLDSNSWQENIEGRGMQEKTYDVLGIGHALVDASFSVSEAFLTERGLAKGQMTLCDDARLQALRAALPADASSVSAGGSCSNTLALLGCLGRQLKMRSDARYAFVGRVGSDSQGEDFRRSMEQSDIECRLEVADQEMADQEVAEKDTKKRESTGQCLVLVTEDAQRTFATHLGASSDIAVLHLDEDLLRRARYLYLEGYLLGGEQGRQVFEYAAASCRKASSVLSLSLSDPSCVCANRDFLLRFVREEVGLLFANEEEGLSLFSLARADKTAESIAASRKELITRCATLGCRVCLTLGAEGALLFDCASGKEGSKEGTMRVSTAAPPSRCIDTTGAGDAFAAGMLFGLSQGWSQEKAGVLANSLGGAVTSEVGPRLTAALQPFLDAVEKVASLP